MVIDNEACQYKIVRENRRPVRETLHLHTCGNLVLAQINPHQERPLRRRLQIYIALLNIPLTVPEPLSNEAF